MTDQQWESTKELFLEISIRKAIKKLEAELEAEKTGALTPA